jgi:hypothetical protein
MVDTDAMMHHEEITVHRYSFTHSQAETSGVEAGGIQWQTRLFLPAGLNNDMSLCHQIPHHPAVALHP